MRCIRLTRLLAAARGTLLVFACLAAGCASGPIAGAPSNSADPIVNGQGGSGGAGTSARFLSLSMSVNPNGRIETSGRGYYVFLINTFGQQIEVTDLDTFTDFIRFDGRNWDWYHRQATQPSAGFQFYPAGNLNTAGQITPDGRTIQLILDTQDGTNLINQYVVASRFSMHALTSDNFNNAVIGRVLDTMGPGPDLSNDSLQTMQVVKTAGAVPPVPQFYPVDPLGDFITQSDLAPDFPYVNFDIARVEITAR